MPLNTNLQTPECQLLEYASVTSRHPPETTLPLKNAHENTGMISPYTHISIDKTQPTLTSDGLPDSQQPSKHVPIPSRLADPPRVTSGYN